MKRTLSFLLVAFLAISSFAADRAHTLKIYNWADYIDENVLWSFPEWYRRQTGEEVEIIYQTFDINESMLTEIEVGKEDYDVICPSEYIIERMLRNNLLQPINKDLVPDSIRAFENVSPFAVGMFNRMSRTVNVSDYAVGYMWGTTGFLYNPAFVSDEEVSSWSALLNPKFRGKIFMKDAFRDVYSVMVLYAYRDDLEAGRVTAAELIGNVTQERIDTVEAVLMAAKDNFAGWEVDFGKEEMAKGNAWLNLSWSGDAQWAIVESEKVGLELRYIVPQEGSNVWFDGWCIPVYAKNTKAATYFINYMCLPQNAIANMEEIGYVSVVATPEVMEYMTDDEIPETYDITYFFGEGADSLHVNPVFYPDRSVIERCALMHDAAENTEALLSMWNRVKGDNLSMGMIVFLVVVVIALLGFFLYRFLQKRNAGKRHTRKTRHRR
ncbi:MAG: ABC transporter substrate-binding protein [Bacteroidales bacterium]|nr:ABC transporter substrate-binding protein [Bacteroidales bacterium]